MDKLLSGLENKSRGDLLFGGVVMLLGLILLLLLVKKTKGQPWSGMEKLLLISTIACYWLDTLWWWFDYHFRWTDLYFYLGGTRFQLTIFFCLTIISFTLLAYHRLKKPRI